MQEYFYKFKILNKGKVDEKDIVISLIPAIPKFDFYKIDEKSGIIPIMNLDIYVEKGDKRSEIGPQGVVVQVTISKKFIEKKGTTKNFWGRPRPNLMKGPIELSMYVYDKVKETGNWQPIKMNQNGIDFVEETKNKDGLTFVISEWPADDRMIGRG